MYLGFLLLLLFFGTLRWFGFLFNLGLLVLERSEKLREQARALWTVFLLGSLSVSLWFVNRHEKRVKMKPTGLDSSAAGASGVGSAAGAVSEAGCSDVTAALGGS